MAGTAGRSRVGRGLAAALVAAAVAAPLAPAGAEEVAGTGDVRSGNEIAVDRTLVRLYGVAAPAPDERCESADGAFQCGIIAWAELILLADGKPLSCDIEGQGPSGDKLGTCYVGERDVNEALVRSGWAEAAANVERYRVDQEDARRARRGIWAGRVLPPDRRQAP